MVRVRFAPSPTGYLHIGGVRTALFNFLYAKNQGGKFLLRIEDTDRQRSEAKYEKEILTSLEWLGLAWDEAVVRQSERLERYREATKELIEKGLAYEETGGDGRTAVRFRMPEVRETFYDLVRDRVEFDTKLFEDLVIVKSDGYPTYHWACVIDDHDMDISHVIRGEDHLSNTPRQILLYKAMGWKSPKYAHLPLILGSDGAPLSKRHGAVSLSAFREQGYWPAGLLNYLALLGWGAGDNQEFFTLDSLIKKFSIKKINKAGARFNTEKLDWVNAQHIKQMAEDEYIRRITEFYPDRSGFSDLKWKELVLLYRQRIKTWRDLEYQASYCFEDNVVYDAAIIRKMIPNEKVKAAIQKWAEKIEAVSVGAIQELPLQAEHLETLTRDLAKERGLEARDLIHPLRFAVSGQTVTPGLFELMSVLGREKCVRRVKNFLRM